MYRGRILLTSQVADGKGDNAGEKADGLGLFVLVMKMSNTVV